MSFDIVSVPRYMNMELKLGPNASSEIKGKVWKLLYLTLTRWKSKIHPTRRFLVKRKEGMSFTNWPSGFLKRSPPLVCDVVFDTKYVVILFFKIFFSLLRKEKV
jgi:hypothetical protein